MINFIWILMMIRCQPGTNHSCILESVHLFLIGLSFFTFLFFDMAYFIKFEKIDLYFPDWLHESSPYVFVLSGLVLFTYNVYNISGSRAQPGHIFHSWICKRLVWHTLHVTETGRAWRLGVMYCILSSKGCLSLQYRYLHRLIHKML